MRVKVYSSRDDVEKFIAVANGNAELQCPFVWNTPSSNMRFELTISIKKIDPESLFSRFKMFLRSAKKAFQVLIRGEV